MLPSVEAFLALWDDPVEFIEIKGEDILNTFTATIIIDAPCNPVLKFKLAAMLKGEA